MRDENLELMMTVTITKLGRSLGVVIPNAIAREMELTEASVLDMCNTSDVIVLHKRSRLRTRRPLSQIVRGINLSCYCRQSAALASDQWNWGATVNH
jgi:antitoxin component of MazEF toxin-antitoxin module